MCETCGKSFGFVNALAHHKLIHTRRRDHVCKTCDKAFRLKRDLGRHMAVHAGINFFTNSDSTILWCLITAIKIIAHLFENNGTIIVALNFFLPNFSIIKFNFKQI